MSGIITLGGQTLASHDTASNTITLDNYALTNKYYIQGDLRSESTGFASSVETMLYVAGTTNPYLTWNRSLTDSGFDVGSSSNYDFKFTKNGIYFVGFSATFGHVTTNSSRYITASIRGSGDTSESTNDLARGIDQIAQADGGSNDYGNVYVSLVKEFNVNDLINFYTVAGTPAEDAIRWRDTHVTIYMVRPL